jgi:2-amino-4-hydroxy-6-hydroxymethyldihydropteridine diphosphokinase
MAEREFVLVPLNEIMRQFRHPKSGLTVGEMLTALRNEHTNEKNA